ncbi:MAG: Uma2 family endonuclease [Myxococcota bacterium]
MQAKAKLQGTPRRREIYYPESDGKPMGETDLHIRESAWTVVSLQRWFADRQDVYVSRNILLYYVEGDIHKVCSPDVLVTFGRPPGLRRTYKTWVEGKMPDIVMEITSRKTRKNDVVLKRELYASLGVREYVLFDPEHEYLSPPLMLLRLVHDQYVETPSQNGSVFSEVLNMRIYEENTRLRLQCLESGKLLEDLDDAYDLREIAERQNRFYMLRLEQEATRSHHLELRLKDQVSAQEELEKHATEAEARALEEAQERARAKARALEEAQGRARAEARALEEAQERARAEARAREAELQAQQLAAELERLRAQLATKGS